VVILVGTPVSSTWEDIVVSYHNSIAGILTEDGGEQHMWRLIGSSRTPRHMAVQLTSDPWACPIRLPTLEISRGTREDRQVHRGRRPQCLICKLPKVERKEEEEEEDGWYIL
jgi:hypothetical protein